MTVVDVKSMDKKVAQNTTTSKKEVESVGKVVHFVGDVKSEFKKITWTSREELWVYTKIVVIATVVFGLSIYFVDLCIRGVLNSLSSLIQVLGG